jgi:hypothetical protein
VVVRLTDLLGPRRSSSVGRAAAAPTVCAAAGRCWGRRCGCRGRCWEWSRCPGWAGCA